MGQKYQIRTNEKSFFPKTELYYTDYYVNNIFQFIKLLITKRKSLMFVTIRSFKNM